MYSSGSRLGNLALHPDVRPRMPALARRHTVSGCRGSALAGLVILAAACTSSNATRSPGSSIPTPGVSPTSAASAVPVPVETPAGTPPPSSSPTSVPSPTPGSPESPAPSSPGVLSGKIGHPTDPHAVVLRVETAGGFLAPGADLLNVPAFTLYGDDLVVFRPSVDPSGTGYAPLMQATLSPDAVDQILTFALGKGYLRRARDLYRNPLRMRRRRHSRSTRGASPSGSR